MAWCQEVRLVDAWLFATVHVVAQGCYLQDYKSWHCVLDACCRLRYGCKLAVAQELFIPLLGPVCMSFGVSPHAAVVSTVAVLATLTSRRLQAAVHAWFFPGLSVLTYSSVLCSFAYVGDIIGSDCCDFFYCMCMHVSAMKGMWLFTAV
jgi:hypothetical protein